MKKTSLRLAAAVALGATLFAGQAQAATNAVEALQAFQAQGYQAIYDLELRHGVWTAEATTLAGARVDLLLDANNHVSEVTAATAAQVGWQRVTQHLYNLGYRNVHDVEMDDGFWKAEARNLAGFEVELVLHPLTLEVLNDKIDGLGSAVPGVGNPLLTAQQIYAALANAGYRHIHDLEFEGGHWEAEAVNAVGQRVDVRVDPFTGAVVREHLDD